MKVLIINSYYAKGGAARAALRLAQALPSADIQVEHESIYPDCMGTFQKINYLMRVALDRFPGLIRCKKKVMFSAGGPSNKALVSRINSSDADIVHLHWINGGGISLSDLAKINKPIVWSLHDMWAFTGGCHYDGGCGKYDAGCNNCPILNSSKYNDLSHSLSKQKKKLYKELKNINIIGLSSWITSCASKSFTMSGISILNLPNPIDTKLFYPEAGFEYRSILNIPKDKKVILFGAVAAVDDPRKGFQVLMEALNLLPSKNNIELIVFGSKKPVNPPDFGFKTHFVGHINDDTKLRLLYNSADVMIVPSLQENLSNAIMESMACGTPVVAFDIGGNPDMIDHKNNGYLAKPFEPDSLAKGIDWVISSPIGHQIRLNARNRVVNSFDNKVVSERYKILYQRCIENTNFY